jgi:uncharacterized protein YegP (UPF0339 family)
VRDYCGFFYPVNDSSGQTQIRGNAMAAKFEIYKGKIGDFHWRLTHTNGRVIAKSGEGYTTKVNAINGLNSVKENAPNAIVEDETA